MEWKWDGHTWWNNLFHFTYENWYCGLHQYVLYKNDDNTMLDTCEYLEGIKAKAERYKEALYESKSNEEVHGNK